MMPRLLDLFCGAGGAAMGYHRAGFDVLGVDINPQPHYPFEFRQADALTYPLDGFDAIHASPPCQAFTSMRAMPNAGSHDDLLTPTKARLQLAAIPYVIENVPGSPIDVRAPDLFGYLGAIVLCGSMFGLMTDEWELRRHRWFESSISLMQPPCRHSARTVIGFYGDHARGRTRINGQHARGTDICGSAEKMALVRDLMGINWMDWHGATQAIPPAYTEFLGEHLLAVVGCAAA